MTAEEARKITSRKITSRHSQRMQYLFEVIAKSAKHGNNEISVHTSQCSDSEITVLRENGFKVGYDYSPLDGGQSVKIEW